MRCWVGLVPCLSLTEEHTRLLAGDLGGPGFVSLLDGGTDRLGAGLGGSEAGGRGSGFDVSGIKI